MSQFLRFLDESDKTSALREVSQQLRKGEDDARIFEVEPEAFDAVPGKPFAYWVSEEVRQTFERMPAFESEGRTARQGLATAEDFRFVRTWWEEPGDGWHGFAKGGSFSPFYADVYLMAYWNTDGSEIKAGICRRYPYLNGNAEFVAKNPQFYLRPGITWPRRTTSGLSMRAMPQGCIFADKGPAAFVAGNSTDDLMALCAVTNSRAFGLLVSLQLAAADAAARSYEVGVIQKTPLPELSVANQDRLARMAHRAWSLKRSLDTIEENSHAFILPFALRIQLSEYDPSTIESELASVQADIDSLAYELYGFSDVDKAALQDSYAPISENDAGGSIVDGADGDEGAKPIDQTTSLLSWAVGVAFGRFDWRLATGQRQIPPEPNPFDSLPDKSPGMLPSGEEPFHVHAGILVDGEGHQHDLPRLIEQVLDTVGTSVSQDIRR